MPRYEFTKGEAVLEQGANHKAYGINVKDNSDDAYKHWWSHRIEVYGSEELRDKIIELLQKEYGNEESN